MNAVTVDGELLPIEEARKTCKRMFYAGFACLPFFWAVNVWLFWPYFVHGGDSVIQTYTRRSAIGFAVAFCAVIPWMLVFMIGQEGAVGNTVFRRMDVHNWDLAQYFSF